jgi:hypothetical protein
LVFSSKIEGKAGRIKNYFGLTVVGAKEVLYMSNQRRRRLAIGLLGGLLIICLLASTIAYLTNLSLPSKSESSDRLSQLEKGRLAEAQQVRGAFGEAVWPGFGQADIPILEYNEAYAFLVGYPDPPAGWVKVPNPGGRGQAWEAVADDSILNRVYYRQPVADAAGQIGSFTVQVGARWTASITTLEWGKIELVREMRAGLPPVLNSLVPYRLLTSQLLDTDQYIFKVVHESFHAFQGQQAGRRLEQAELAVRRFEDSYPWDDQAQKDGWLGEFQALKAGVQASSTAEKMEAVRQFLQKRQERRAGTAFTPELAAYEMQREWLEGVALYVEYDTWRNLVEAAGYQPQPELENDPNFHGYGAFQSKMDAAIASPRAMVMQRDTRFYSAGMMEAFLLDDLMPGWKAKIFQEGVYLEDLLRRATRG